MILAVEIPWMTYSQVNKSFNMAKGKINEIVTAGYVRCAQGEGITSKKTFCYADIYDYKIALANGTKPLIKKGKRR